MQLGRVCFAVDLKSQAARRPFEHKLLVRETAFQLDGAAAAIGIQQIYKALATDEARNRMILNDVIQAVDEGRSPRFCSPSGGIISSTSPTSSRALCGIWSCFREA